MPRLQEESGSNWQQHWLCFGEHDPDWWKTLRLSQRNTKDTYYQKRRRQHFVTSCHANGAQTSKTRMEIPLNHGGQFVMMSHSSSHGKRMITCQVAEQPHWGGLKLRSAVELHFSLPWQRVARWEGGHPKMSPALAPQDFWVQSRVLSGRRITFQFRHVRFSPNDHPRRKRSMPRSPRQNNHHFRKLKDPRMVPISFQICGWGASEEFRTSMIFTAYISPESILPIRLGSYLWDSTETWESQLGRLLKWLDSMVRSLGLFILIPFLGMYHDVSPSWSNPYYRNFRRKMMTNRWILPKIVLNSIGFAGRLVVKRTCPNAPSPSFLPSL